MDDFLCKQDHQAEMRALQDTLYVLGGKWKIPIVTAIFRGNTRFTDIERSIPGITKRMLSKQLKELEVNRLVIREIMDTYPVTIKYQLADYCMSFCPVVREMVNWGIKHRNQIKQDHSENVRVFSPSKEVCEPIAH